MQGNNFKDIPSLGDAIADLQKTNRAVAQAMQVSKQTASKPIAPLCPNCSAEWSHAELQQQECFTCGHPDPWDAFIDDDKFD